MVLWRSSIKLVRVAQAPQRVHRPWPARRARASIALLRLYAVGGVVLAAVENSNRQTTSPHLTDPDFIAGGGSDSDEESSSCESEASIIEMEDVLENALEKMGGQKAHMTPLLGKLVKLILRGAMSNIVPTF